MQLFRSQINWKPIIKIPVSFYLRTISGPSKPHLRIDGGHRFIQDLLAFAERKSYAAAQVKTNISSGMLFATAGLMLLQDLSIDDLRKVIAEEARHFCKALEEGASWEALSEIRDKVRLCTKIIDLKLSALYYQKGKSAAAK